SGHQGNSSGAILTSSSNNYDPATGLVSTVFSDGTQTDYTYDYQDRVLTTTVHPSSGTLMLAGSNVYDRYHLTKSVDYYGRGTSFTYDAMDRTLSAMVQLTPCGATITTHSEYDPEGNVSASVDGNGNRTEYQY